MKYIKSIILVFMIVILSGCDLFGKTNPKITINYNCEGISEYKCSTLDNKLNCMFIMPECNNLYFTGWYDAKENGQIVNLDSDFLTDSTIYAGWSSDKSLAWSTNSNESAKYVISFNANGGSGGQSANVVAIYNENMPEIDKTIPTRQGYIFTGWYDNSDYTKGKDYYTDESNGIRKYDVEKNITLYAGWKDNSTKLVSIESQSEVLTKYIVKYDITFNLNGGSGNIVNKVVATYYGDLPSIGNVIPTRAGYTFKGWYDNSQYSSGKMYYNSSLKSVRQFNEKKNITLYAGWKANKYKISFDSNGVNITSKSVEATYNHWLPSISCNKTRADAAAPKANGVTYKFAGWYDENDIEYYNYKCQAVKNYNVAANITLYAKWKIKTDLPSESNVVKKYVVSFNYNGASGTQSNIEVAHKEKMPTLSSSIPTRKGYTFTGWYDNSNYRDGVKYYDDKLSSSRVFSENGNITLYAGWKVNTYKISFDSNGGTGGQSKQLSAVYFSILPEISKYPPKNGNIEFIGWYDAKTGGKKYYNELGEAVTYYDVDKNLVLYARWQKNTVSFNLNGGEGALPSSFQIEYNESLPKINTTIPIKKGHTFTGWYDNSDYSKGTSYYNANNQAIKKYDVSKDLILYAGWKANTYKISFNANGGIGSIPSTVTAAYGKVVPKINETSLSKEGYTFVGWYDNSDYTKGTKYYNDNLNSAITYNKTGDTILYAGWSKNYVNDGYIINFDNNGGRGTVPQSITVSYNSVLPELNIAVPTKSGYIFDGYYDSKNGGNQYYSKDLKPQKKYNKNSGTTLYAGWVPSGNLKIYYLSLSRYDGYLIIGNGTTIFIDGGDPEPGREVVQFLNKMGITKIDALIGSHLHDNHIDAHKEIIKDKNIEVKAVYYPDDPRTCQDRKTSTDSVHPDELNKLIENNNIPVKIMTPQLDYKIGNLTFDILGPLVLGSSANNNSAHMILKYGNHKFYFSGDSGTNVFKSIYNKYDHSLFENITIFKHPHHGQNKVPKNFIEVMKPKYVIVPNTKKHEAGNEYEKSKTIVYALGSVYGGYVLAETDGKTLKVTDNRNATLK